MYQSLIWAFDLSNHPGRLGTAFDTEDGERLPYSLVDRVGRDFQLRCNLFRVEMLVDEEEAVQLALGKLGDARGHQVRCARVTSIMGRFALPVRVIQSSTHPAQHAAYSRAESSARTLGHVASISQFSTDFTPFSS
jgi:hypothetical protein